MTFRPVLIALMLQISVCGLAGGLPPNKMGAQDIVARAFADEKLPESGTLRFRIRVEGDDPASLKSREARDLDYVDFSWAPGKKFRIDLVGQGGLIRSVVSDGRTISTGFNVWDARFAWDYEPHNHETNSKLCLKLDEEMWVYSHLLTLHMHPLSGFENDLTFEQFVSVFTISIPRSGVVGAPETMTVKVQYPGKREYFRNLEIETAGKFMFAKSNLPPGNLGGGLTYQRSAPVEIAGLGWLPKTCVVTPEGDSASGLRWTSEVVPEATFKPVDASLFEVNQAGTGLILWPYGTRMNNFRYGFVDTIQDWWEGVSDGVIGD